MPYPEGMASSSTAPNHPYPGNWSEETEFRDRAWRDLDLVTAAQNALTEAFRKIQIAEACAAGQSYGAPIYALRDVLPDITEMQSKLEADAALIEREAGI